MRSPELTSEVFQKSQNRRGDERGIAKKGLLGFW
jgi:hypothetical protein